MMTPSSFPRVAFPLRIFALWREAIFDFQFFYPMNFGNDIEVTDKLSLQMSFCMTGKTIPAAGENYPDFLTSTFVFPLS